MENCILVSCSAYNAEQTIAKTIESVLNQTYPNFILCISTNACIDKTNEICMDYAKNDNRIQLMMRQMPTSGLSFINYLYGQYRNSFDTDFYGKDYGLIENINEKDLINQISQGYNWVCWIDADDTCEPTYLEDMLKFATENNLKMVMCGWNFVRPDQVDTRVLDDSKILTIKEFAQNLSVYDKFTGPMWNKLFRADLLGKNIQYYERKFNSLFRDGTFFYGADTCFVYFMLSQIDKTGILNKSLYNYNILDGSASRKSFNPMLTISSRRSAEVRFDFLQEVGVEITDELKKFIHNIYFKTAYDCVERICKKEDLTLDERMKYLKDIFGYYLMDEAIPPAPRRYL